MSIGVTPLARSTPAAGPLGAGTAHAQGVEFHGVLRTPMGTAEVHKRSRKALVLAG